MERGLSKRAESLLMELRANPVQRPTIIRSVDNTGSSPVGLYDGDRRSPRPRRDDHPDAVQLGCVWALPALIVRLLRGA